MASFKYEFKAVDDLFTRITVASSTVADAVLMAGADAVRDNMVAAGMAAGYGAPGTSGRGTGRMLDSIAYDKIKVSGDSKSVDIYPRGVHHKKERNARIGFVLNYGRKNMAGSHWIDGSREQSEAAATAAMIAKFNQLTSQ